MFKQLEDVERRYEGVNIQLQNPDVASDQKLYQKLMKELADLEPVVKAYRSYRQAEEDITSSIEILETEKDEEMRQLAKEELSDAEKRKEQL